jgi:DNA-binding beta-propeller fold protein YncE
MVFVDEHNNVWFLHRPRNPSIVVPPGKTPAPPVLEFTASGKFLQAWGGPGSGYDWPDTEHNIGVYHDDVWITGSSPNNSRTANSDDMLLKFTTKGKFLLELGGRSVSLGNMDTKSVNKPGGLFMWPNTNELFIADGYGNRRVIVFDAATLTFKRMWGAFGKPVTDVPGSGGRGTDGGPALAVGTRPENPGPRTLDTDGPGSPDFALPHGIAVSNDGIVYVADRPNRRIQLFTTSGKYITQIFINRDGPSSSSASGIAFSPDKAQKFLYVADYGNSRIVVMDREKRTVLYQFGKRGAAPGDFQGVHNMAVDADGNLYTAEVAPGARLQRFKFTGMSATLPPNALTPAELAPKAK